MTTRPLPEPEASFVRLIESMNRAQENVLATAGFLSQQLGRGGVPTSLAARYNFVALDLRAGFAKALGLLRRMGAPALASDPPWPSIFVDKVTSAGDKLSLPDTLPVLTPDRALVVNSPRGVGGTSNGGNTLALAPLAIGLIVVSTSAVIAYFASDAYVRVRTREVIEETNRLVAELQAKQYELQTAQVRWRADRVSVGVEHCIQKGVDYVTCAKIAGDAVESTPAPTDIAKALRELRALENPEKGFLWWFGLFVVGTGVIFAGTVVAKKWYDRKHKREQ